MSRKTLPAAIRDAIGQRDISQIGVVSPFSNSKAARCHSCQIKMIRKNEASTFVTSDRRVRLILKP